MIIEFIDTPDATVTDVGAVALANGTVKVCDNGCTPVLQAYEIMPSTLIVATYCPAPTSEYSTNENVGANTGVWLSHAGEHNLCTILTCTKYGESTLPKPRVGVMFAEFCLQPI